MCGIAGLVNFGSSSVTNMEKMKTRMVHRGPDGEGTWLSEDGRVCLGHQRLAILDLSENGRQPFVSASGRYVIVYNGEIYNFHELRDKLLGEKKVQGFRSTCDTEILLEGIEAYGLENTLNICRGMFAIGVYDRKERILQLARDRIGEKPLYYGFLKGSQSFAFASDIGSIAALDGFCNPINTAVLNIYFEQGFIPAPYSIYEGISKLMPGTILTLRSPFGPDNLQQQVYWSIRDVAARGQKNLFTGTRREAADELERLLRSSIREQMVADVPLGAFLSAGIDSSTVVSLMQEENPGKVRTFTIGMEDSTYNEATYAAEIAAHLGTDHTQMYITEKDAMAVVPELAHMFSEPFADSSQIPTYLVSRMTREHVTVSLSGDGGDELFCGYTSYASVERIWGKIRYVPRWLRKPASALVLASPMAQKDIWRIKGKLLSADGPEDIYRMSFCTDPVVEQITRDHRVLPYAYTQTAFDELREVNHDIMLMDMRMYHPDDILVKVDRTAMAVSLETRVPMLDRDVVEFAWTLPVEYLRDNVNREGEHAGDNSGGTVGKLVLRDVLYRYVPRSIMDRPKKGFSIPVDQWLLTPGLRGWAESLLDRRLLEQQQILNPEVVRRIWEDYTERGIWRIQIWYILMFQAWMAQEYVGRNGQLHV